MTAISNVVSEKMLSLVACAKCHQAISLVGEQAACPSCGSVVALTNGVVMTEEFSRGSYFDSVFELMREGNRERGTWNLFYRQQAQLLGESLHPDDIVVDVGCGPELPYAKKSAFVIGVDASYDSIQANAAVDLRVYASAAALPLRNGVADVVVCFYSIHHMTGTTTSENRAIVHEVFREFGRVLKRSGRLLIFDVSPRWPFGIVEDLSWNTARKVLGPGLDMYFWTRRRLIELGSKQLPGAKLHLRHFTGSPLETFPPVFSKPALRLPRMLYPFNICLYEWTLSGETQPSV